MSATTQCCHVARPSLEHNCSDRALRHAWMLHAGSVLVAAVCLPSGSTTSRHKDRSPPNEKDSSPAELHPNCRPAGVWLHPVRQATGDPAGGVVPHPCAGVHPEVSVLCTPNQPLQTPEWTPCASLVVRTTRVCWSTSQVRWNRIVECAGPRPHWMSLYISDAARSMPALLLKASGPPCASCLLTWRALAYAQVHVEGVRRAHVEPHPLLLPLVRPDAGHLPGHEGG